LSKFHLILLIHAHQPVGNFDEVIEGAYVKSYLPFVQLLLQHPQIRVGLHYSGPLLEWCERRHPEFFDLLRELIQRGQAELVGGGFYEPILISIPPEDRHEQIRRMGDYMEKRFGRRPAGAWLAERVWEPQLPSTFAKAGVDYTLTDDMHFLASGFELEQLSGYYVAEDLGATVKVIPGLKSLRYLIPFRSVEETMEFLRSSAQKNPGGFAAMGDDCEKFGVWPETHQHCYTNGWLERFFAAVEAAAEWLTVTPPGEYLASHLPLGRADLPAAAYTEMTEWALPTPARARYQALQQEFSGRPDAQAFLRGGFWRGFFSKYTEANLLHKKMLHVSQKVHRMGVSSRRGLPVRGALEDATQHVLRAQCNDAYWHGIFGGVYAPHLRTFLWRELIRAERLADAADHGRATYTELMRIDFDADGQEEIYATSDQYAALIKPSDGATLPALDFRASDVTLINSVQRRPEPYHAKLREAVARGGGAVSIHDQVRVKEEGLERWLHYDRWPRHAFRLLLFAPGKNHADYEAGHLEESAAFAAARYEVNKAAGEEAKFICEAPLGLAGEGIASDGLVRAEKTFSFTRSRKNFSVACDVALSSSGGSPVSLQLGLEVVINLLAPEQPDRYFEYLGARYPLRWSAAVAASQLRLVDEWQDVAITLEAPGARDFWVAPIETVCESEEGFERVYQGSNILTVWPGELQPGKPWTGRLTLHVSKAR